jgi:hypothetical protein
MDDKIIAIFCLCDDLLKAMHHQEDCQCQMNDAEIMTTAFIAALFFRGNHATRIPHPISCDQTHFFCWYVDLNEAIPIGGFQSPSCIQQPKASVGERYA